MYKKKLKPEPGKKLNLTECPFCKGKTYVVKRYVKGSIDEYYDFKNNKLQNTKEDDLKNLSLLNHVYTGTYIECANCHRRICKVDELER